MAFSGDEEAILDLVDAGLAADAIVARGFSASRVRFTISTFGSARRQQASDRKREAAIRRGSRELLAAITNARRS